MRAEDRVPAACLAAWFGFWAICAISPRDRTDWALENVLTLVTVPVLVLTYRRFRFSDRAYLQIGAFMFLHAIGGHYTYSEVPLGYWLRDGFGLARNHFDRLVHFSFGLLMLRPMRELGFRHVSGLGRFGNVYFATAGVGLWSLLYEVLEWGVAAVVAPEAGSAYLGTQGDEWDAQKDMALAVLGAFLAALFQYRPDGRATSR